MRGSEEESLVDECEFLDLDGSQEFVLTCKLQYICVCQASIVSSMVCVCWS